MISKGVLVRSEMGIGGYKGGFSANHIFSINVNQKFTQRPDVAGLSPWFLTFAEYDPY